MLHRASDSHVALIFSVCPPLVYHACIECISCIKDSMRREVRLGGQSPPPPPLPVPLPPSQKDNHLVRSHLLIKATSLTPPRPHPPTHSLFFSPYGAHQELQQEDLTNRFVFSQFYFFIPFCSFCLVPIITPVGGNQQTSQSVNQCFICKMCSLMNRINRLLPVTPPPPPAPPTPTPSSSPFSFFYV